MKQILLSDYETVEDPGTGDLVSRRMQIEAQHPWPESVFIQGGKRGVVIAGKNSYMTAFVEVFPAHSFIRGEGDTVEEAETKCWEKYMKQVACSDHEWKPNKRKNGSGTCIKCQAVQTGIFSSE